MGAEAPFPRGLQRGGWCAAIHSVSQASLLNGSVGILSPMAPGAAMESARQGLQTWHHVRPTARQVGIPGVQDAFRDHPVHQALARDTFSE